MRFGRAAVTSAPKLKVDAPSTEEAGCEFRDLPLAALARANYSILRGKSKRLPGEPHEMRGAGGDEEDRTPDLRIANVSQAQRDVNIRQPTQNRGVVRLRLDFATAWQFG